MTCVISLCTKILTYNDYIYLYSRRNDILDHDLSTNMTYHRKFNMNNWTVSMEQGLLTRPSTWVDLLLTYLLLFLFVVRFAQLFSFMGSVLWTIVSQFDVCLWYLQTFLIWTGLLLR